MAKLVLRENQVLMENQDLLVLRELLAHLVQMD